jgi:hypothetical protein
LRKTDLRKGAFSDGFEKAVFADGGGGGHLETDSRVNGRRADWAERRSVGKEVGKGEGKRRVQDLELKFGEWGENGGNSESSRRGWRG